MPDESHGTAAALRFGPWLALVERPRTLGLVITGLCHPEAATPADYLHEVLLTPEHRAQLWALVDREGLVICKNVVGAHPSYRDVRGRSSRGRLSQGEYYHHDGCSGPQKPRVVEIRCPQQEVPRRIATAVAPFPRTVYAMLRVLPPSIAGMPDIAPHAQRLTSEHELPRDTWDGVQGIVTRAVRRDLDPESARAYFRAVDDCAGAYREPWEMGESRLIANENAGTTMQHRRAYLEPHRGGLPTGHLVKRWPAEEL